MTKKSDEGEADGNGKKVYISIDLLFCTWIDSFDWVLNQVAILLETSWIETAEGPLGLPYYAVKR